MNHITRTHASCRTYNWVNVSCSKNPMKKWGVMQDSCEFSHTYKRLMTCHTYKRVTSHVQMSHVTPTNETKKIQINLVTHTKKSRDAYPEKMRGLLQESPRSKHCNTLQQGGGCCWNRHIQIIWRFSEYVGLFRESVGLFPVPHTHTYSDTLQHTAIQCNNQQTHCKTLQHTAERMALFCMCVCVCVPHTHTHGP